MNWTATLIGWRGSAADITAAERRFKAYMEAELGSKLTDTYRAWLNASSQTHDTPREMWPAEARIAVELWERPFAKACAQALDSLPGKGSEAWFDVQLDGWP
ncbi:MAG: hypothetical protein AB7P37_23065 [Ramlibacter sp.]